MFSFFTSLLALFSLSAGISTSFLSTWNYIKNLIHISWHFSISVQIIDAIKKHLFILRHCVCICVSVYVQGEVEVPTVYSFQGMGTSTWVHPGTSRTLFRIIDAWSSTLQQLYIKSRLRMSVLASDFTYTLSITASLSVPFLSSQPEWVFPSSLHMKWIGWYAQWQKSIQLKKTLLEV